MSINILGTMRVDTRDNIGSTRLSGMTIEITHEDYDRFYRIYSNGDWRNRVELLEYCLYAGMAKIEKTMEKNGKLKVEYDE